MPIVGGVILSACVETHRVNVDVQQTNLLPKPAALSFLRTVPKKPAWIPCEYEETGIAWRGRTPIPYERWIVTYTTTIAVSHVVASLANGPRGLLGKSACTVFHRDPRLSGPDPVVSKSITALVSLGAKQYRPPAGQ